LRRLTVLAVAFALAALVVGMLARAPLAQTSPDEPAALPPGLNEDDPLVQDARWYASDQGVGLEEAVRRLKLQDAIGELDAALTEKERATFAGLFIQHQPEFRVVARFTQGGAETIRPYVAGGPLEGIVEVQSASATLAELEVARERAADIVDGLGIQADSGTDVRDNRAELWVTDRARLEAALQAAGVQLPEEVGVVEVEELAAPEANIYAGLWLNYDASGNPACTSGFSVRTVTGTRGVTTAGHCDNTLYRGSTQLDFQQQRFRDSYDVQWHVAPGFTVRPWARDGYNNSGDTTPNYRLITGSTSHANQSAGDLICKYGAAMGETRCGYIDRKNFEPSGPDYPNDMDPTFILVFNDEVDLSIPGDSGGPYFVGGRAYGIHNVPPITRLPPTLITWRSTT
jgi:streptogrisin C